VERGRTFAGESAEHHRPDDDGEQEREDEDRRLPVIGRFFTNRFVLGVDDTEYLIEVRNGKIQRIAEG